MRLKCPSSLILLLLAVACGDDKTGNGGGDSTPALELSLNPATLTLEPGVSATLTATLTRANLDGAVVTLAAANQPSDLTVTFDTIGIVGNSATITVSASPNAALASHDITVSATAGDLTRSATLTIITAYGAANRTNRIISGGVGVANLAVDVYGANATSATRLTTGPDGRFTANALTAPYDVVFTGTDGRKFFFPELTGDGYDFATAVVAPQPPAGQYLIIDLDQQAGPATFCIAHDGINGWGGSDQSGIQITIQTTIPLNTTPTIKLTCLSANVDNNGFVTDYVAATTVDVSLEGDAYTSLIVALTGTAPSATNVTLNLEGIPQDLTAPQVILYFAINGGGARIGECHGTTSCSVPVPASVDLPILAQVSVSNGAVGSALLLANQTLSASSAAPTLRLPRVPVVLGPSGANVSHTAKLEAEAHPDVIHFFSIACESLVQVGTKSPSVDINRIERHVFGLTGTCTLTVAELPSASNYNLERSVLNPKGDLAEAISPATTFTLAD